MSPFTGTASLDEDENFAVFKPVIAAIKFEAIPHFASAIRQKRDQQAATFPSPAAQTPNIGHIQCTISSQPLFGSYNVLYPIAFADGLQWLIKIPAKGYHGRWTNADARATASEALTMQLIKRQTTIPVPEVFAYQSTLVNELNCPFILMDFIEGVSLHDFWFDNSHTSAEIEQRRRKILEQVASSMMQMNQFRFYKGGSILFKDDGKLDIGPMQRDDHQAMLDRLQTDDEPEPTATFEAGPFYTKRDFFHCCIDRREAPADKISRGLHKLLRLFLAWIPYTDIAGEPAFVLTHPDFDIQNIIVSPEGELRGFIDWDGVAAEPSCLGNERYPSWLTRDWDPMMYRYRPSASSPGEGRPDAEGHHEINIPNMSDNEEPSLDTQQDRLAREDSNTDSDPAAPEPVRENSPKELSRYREMYQHFIAAPFRHALEDACRHNPAYGRQLEALILEPYARLTRNSLMIDNLAIAANNPLCTDGILEKIFEEIVKVTEDAYKDAEGNEDEDSDVENVEEDKADAEAVALENDAVEETDNLDDSAEGGQGENDGGLENRDGGDGNVDECFDLGGFNLGDVALALMDCTLDEARLARLRSGFAALCS